MPVQGNKYLAMRAKADDVIAGLRRVAVTHRRFGARTLSVTTAYRIASIDGLAKGLHSLC
jgi:hypothetical protein